MNDDELREDEAEVARLQARLAPLRFRAGEVPLPRRAGRTGRATWVARVGAVAAMIAIAAAGTWLGRTRVDRSSLAATAVSGAPTIAGAPLTAGASLPPGSWLETDPQSRARVHLPGLGEVEVLPGSRLRALPGVPGHHLELAHGAISARVDAPPRLFVIDTPSASAIDLGCAYTLETDDDGNGSLRVTSGWVELSWHGHPVRVLDGTTARLSRNGASLPLRDDAPEAVVRAAALLENGDASIATTLANEARLEDAITLWNALPRVAGASRELLEARLRELVPPPESVTRDAVLALDAVALESWVDAIRAADHAPPHD